MTASGTMTARSDEALTLVSVCKSFDRPAVDHLNLSIRRGELYALAGLQFVAGRAP